MNLNRFETSTIQHIIIEKLTESQDFYTILILSTQLVNESHIIYITISCYLHCYLWNLRLKVCKILKILCHLCFSYLLRLIIVCVSLVSVNGELITQCQHDEAVNILRNAGDFVVLTVKHYKAATPFLQKNSKYNFFLIGQHKL